MNMLAHAPLIEAKSRQTLSLAGLATVWGALLIFMGLFYRTYDIAMASVGMEFSRQIGTPILVVEIAVTAFALSNGMILSDYWKRLSTLTRCLLAIFLSTFWVSSVFVSAIPPAAIMLNFGVVVQILFCMSLCHCLALVDRRGLERMRTIFLGTMLIFSVMILYQFVLATPPHKMTTWQFAIPGFISVRIFGAVCGALVAYFLMTLLIDEEAHRARSWHYLALAFVLGLVIWTGTRAAVLGVVAALAIAVVFYRIRPAHVVFAKLCATVVVAATVATLLLPPDPCFSLFQTGDYQSMDTATAGRLELWKVTWNAFLTVPVFGAGPAANSWMMPPDIFPHVQPHNVILQFLINWGLSGALPAFGLLCIATWRAHQIVRTERYLLAVLAMLDCLLVMSFVDGILHFARETMMVMMCYAIIFRAGRDGATSKIAP